MLTVIIPSKNEKFLDNTIRDVLENATGEIEVLPVLDGYETEEIDDPRVTYVKLPPTGHSKKRQGINLAVSEAKGEYVMSLDAHCLVAKGFDEQLIKDHKPNWVQVPRRHRLDAEKWCLQSQGDGRPPIDYEYIMYPPRFKPMLGFHGFKWDARTKERADIMIDDILTFQGSCWFMTKEWFNKCGFMDLRYMGWGQEAEELSFTTWQNGGEVKINKNTYYAHLHKGKKYGRMYFMSRDENRKSYKYSYERWKDDPTFEKLINKFMPMPNWSNNWKEEL